MKYEKWIWRGLAVALPMALLPQASLPLARAQDALPGGATGVSSQVFDANTNPSETRHPSFLQQGIIKEVFVKEGDKVTVGQELATEDADLDILELKSMQMDAEAGQARINASAAERDSKQEKLDHLNALAKGSATGEEVREAELDLTTAAAEVEYAHASYAKLVADLDKQSAKIEKMKLISSIDGIIKKVDIHQGDFVDPSKPEGVMTIVKNDPLNADVGIPTKLAFHLKVGDTLPISYKDIDPSNWLTAKIKSIDPVASAGSDQETIRLEIDNASGMRAGYWINVKLPDTQQASTK